jgi:predicted lipoprotein with Yx(FWY)xxD motif
MKFFACSLVAAMLISGCGGGSSAMAPVRPPMPNNSGPLSTATLNGAPGYVNSGGFTVYVFDADLAAPGQSTCNGACAQNWPHVATPSGSLPAPWGSIVRQDGSSQLTYNGRPLYTFAFDTAPGQTNGDGVNAFGGLWHIARPQGSASPSPHASGY